MHQVPFKSIAEYQSVDEATFEDIQRLSRPAILKGCNFGECIDKWTLDYITTKLDNESIVIHESDQTDLDFLSKNFKYRRCKFSEFSKRLKVNEQDSHIYLRSISTDDRSKKPARIEDDFQSLRDDLKPPSFIPFGASNPLYHSSVLRIASSNVQIWTHFDTYNNVLCQTEGSKRIILLPPDDIKYLYIKGDKSMVNNFDNWSESLKKYPLLQHANPHECILAPGDVLFIPAFWWHNIRTITHNDQERYSIGFNLFWRDPMIDSLYPPRDVYGNKNLTTFDAALACLERAINHLEKLPAKYKEFYKMMLLEEHKAKFSVDDTI